MDIMNKDFFYTSLDLQSDKLPSRAIFIKKLQVSSGDISRDCAIIKLENKPDYCPSHYLVIVPRNRTAKLFNDLDNDRVSLFVFDGETYLDKETIELTGKKDFIDIGLISFLKERL